MKGSNSIKVLDIDIVKWDERLTTVFAYSTMKELGIKQTQKNKYADKLAATKILQEYLDYLHGLDLK